MSVDRGKTMDEAVIAVDVGGTTIKIATMTTGRELTDIHRFATPAPGENAAERVMTAVGAAVTAHAREHRFIPTAVGVALPGIFDEDRGRGIWSENLGWRDADFAALARRVIPLPTVLRHDVRSAATAEREAGAAAGGDTALVVVIGTGISAALFLPGQTRPHVAHGYAGEIGHAVVVPDGELCVCGNRGCLEATSSAAALVRRYVRDSGHPVSGADVVLSRAADGDAVAHRVWDSALDALAAGLAHSIALTSPDVVVLGGGLAEAGDHLIAPLEERLARLLRVTPMPRLRRAAMGQDAGLYGVGLAALARRGGPA